jgi:CRISPR-associated endonuclease Csn1
MIKKILGLDLGTNSIGWALLSASDNNPEKILDLGCRIFNRAVEDKTPTPKNVARRNGRLARRVLQRRKRRKNRVTNYLISLSLLPKELKDNPQPEIILNSIGDPYRLRTLALDEKLEPFELGRVILHLTQRRGFLSNRKTILGDLADDPDVVDALKEVDKNEDNSSEITKEETAFKEDIEKLREDINKQSARTLGEYLALYNTNPCKRNRSRWGGHLRTDRKMYQDELHLIFQQQQKYHSILTRQVQENIEEIIFFQRPLKFKKGSIGKCTLEPNKYRAAIARLESQRFRYLQDINNLQYFDRETEKWTHLSDKDKEKLIEIFEHDHTITYPKIRKALKLATKTEFNLESTIKKLKGNTTSCKVRAILKDWDSFDNNTQRELIEDLLTIKKKSILKNRLLNHWKFSVRTSVDLCMLELEPGHLSLSLKAINKLLPYLQSGLIYSEARKNAGYGYDNNDNEILERLGPPPEIPNPIVQKSLFELKRLVNAIIAEHGKIDAIRIEMARDLEMNTKRYQAYLKRQKDNTKENDKALEAYKEMLKKNPHLKLSEFMSKGDKLKYRLWLDQDMCCVYSGRSIKLSSLFSSEIDVDHILPYSLSLDDSYMNKVVCFTQENRYKGQQTPYDAYGGSKQWEQITQRVQRWPKNLRAKRDKFYINTKDLTERDFISSQLNDARYISKVAGQYLKSLGADITVSKGITTSWLRHMWGLNSILGTSAKNRSDHRHHAIDATVIACVDRSLYKTLTREAKRLERSQGQFDINRLHLDPPWLKLREDLIGALNNIIVSHTPQRKLFGALHEDTGAGFLNGVGTVYRKDVSPNLTSKHIKSVIDKEVVTILEDHLKKFNNDPRAAFADDVTVFHKDGRTPIKRVRVIQSTTNRKKLESTKYGVKNKQGKIFKWMPFGNIHHIEVIKSSSSNTNYGVFVTTFEANHRAKGINRPKQNIIRKDHNGDKFQFALHINDLVTLTINGISRIYRVQKLGQLDQKSQPRPTLIPHNIAAGNDDQISDSIKNLMSKYAMRLLKVNVTGKVINDQNRH